MKRIRCAVALFIVLTIPGYAVAQGPRPGGRGMSVPEQLSAIDETVRAIQSVVYQISPIVPQYWCEFSFAGGRPGLFAQV